MQRNFTIDVLKVIFAVMVVAIHTKFLLQTSLLANHLFVDGLFRIAVPFFFLINGYYLFAAIQEPSKFLVWLKRVICMYLFWMFVYFPLYAPTDINFFTLLSTIAKKSLVGYLHLWYIFGMIGGGVLLFFCRKYSDQFLIKIGISLFMFSVVIQYCEYYQYKNTWPLWSYRNFLFFSFPLMLIGYLVKKNKVEETIRSKLLWVTAAFGTFILILEILSSWYFSKNGAGAAGFNSYVALLLLGPVLLVLSLKLDFKTKNPHYSIFSSWLYFIHPMLIYIAVRVFHENSGLLQFAVVVFLAFIFYYPAYLFSKRFKFVL